MTVQEEIAAYLAEWDMRGAGVWADTPEEAADDIEQRFIRPVRAEIQRRDERIEQQKAEIERLRAELNSAQLARECGWPGCTATYQADTGPHSEPWSRHRLPDITLCPVHAWGEHYPSGRIEDAENERPRVRAACHCGWSDADLVRTRGESAFRWQRHIVQSTDTSGGAA